MLPLRRATGGSTTTAWEEFDKNRAFIRPERIRYELKLEKIAAEREKARRKRDEWEERRKEWDRKYHEQENSEICEMVHAQSLTPEQLAVIIQLAQAAVPNPENLKLDEKETEDME